MEWRAHRYREGEAIRKSAGRRLRNTPMIKITVVQIRFSDPIAFSDHWSFRSGIDRGSVNSLAQHPTQMEV